MKSSNSTHYIETRHVPYPWHAMTIDRVFSTLGSMARGLSQDEAERRINHYGPNRLRSAPSYGYIRRFLAQFHNLLIYVLLFSSMITLLLEHWVDSGVILAVVLINAIIGVVQEGKAEQALKAIRQMLPHQATARRGGHLVSLAAADLVPGDVVQLQAGDKVPADIRLFQIRNLRIEEAVLTGESVTIEKQSDLVAEPLPLGDRLCMAYSGTLVTYGQGIGVVVASGDYTEIGKISAMLERVETLTTPLLRQMNQFGRTLTLVIIMLALLTATLGITIHHYPISEMFLAAVGLAVAAIPEGLPAIMTITLAIGVQRMAQRNAIIRRLPAVETLGSVSVICSDKTGTLTRNEMTVRSLLTATDLLTTSGVGYNPHGSFLKDGEECNLEHYASVRELIRAGILCNDARLNETDGRWGLDGDPTEGALLTLGIKAGLAPEFQNEEWPRIDVIPFEAEHRFMASLHHDHAGHGFIYIKGAPELILQMCAFQLHQGESHPIDRAYWEPQIDELARKGQRLLALAVRTTDIAHESLQFTDVAEGLTLLGIVGIIDPPREDAIIAVAQCQSAGIRVKMITGDHALTAVAIGQQLGIGQAGAVLTGADIDELSTTQLNELVTKVDIFARSSPSQKLRLVKALQENGLVTAMTGDGVNDAPALKRADVGVAMGSNGTEVAKEAAEMVLVDDNFASIVHAVEEGRTVYDNLRKAILFILPTNGAEALILITAILLGFEQLPITPVQILWINMITAVTLALAFAFEHTEPGIMQRPPRNPHTPLLSRLFIWRIIYVALWMTCGSIGLFQWVLAQGLSIETARTVAVNTLIFYEIFYLFNARFISAPVLNRQGLLGNHYALWAIAVLIVIQLVFTYHTGSHQLFGVTSIDAMMWGRIVLVASTILFLVELEKWILRTTTLGQHFRHQ